MTGDLAGAWAGMHWTTAPATANQGADGTLLAAAVGGTDFWQRTFYGFEHDDGHALLAPRAGDFTATLDVDAHYQSLYDQAGLMLRAGPSVWVKFGVEMTDGLTHLSVVVTDGLSDWSARPIALDGPLTLRATRLGKALLLQHAQRQQERDGPDAHVWRMARLAPFTESEVGVGPYLCAPQRAPGGDAFSARFLNFSVTPAQVRTLHA